MTALTTKTNKKERGGLQRNFLCSVGIVICVFFALADVLWTCHLQKQLREVQKELQENKAEIELLTLEHELMQDSDEEGDYDWSLSEPKSRITRSIKSKRKSYCHLTGIGITDYHEQRSGGENEFKWNNDADLCSMDAERKQGHTNKIIIHKKGFYFIYTQLVFYDKGEDEIAFQIVRENDELDERGILMMSVTTPNRADNSRGKGNAVRHAYSGYSAGMFKLNQGDRVYVEPKETPTDVKFRMGEKESFFGMFKL